MIHEFVEYERIKEPLCLEFFKTCIGFQREDKHQDFTGISYKELMKRMHIGRDMLQRLLNCVHRNWVYFKIEHGYMVEVHNITSGVDWSRRFFYDGKPFYHIKINLYYKTHENENDNDNENRLKMKGKNEDCRNEATAEMLLHKYTELYNRKKAAEEEMNKLEQEMVDTCCVYQLGQEFVDRSGNHAVLTEIKVSTYRLQYGAYGCEPSIGFQYNFRKVRKDDQLSLNHFYVNLHDATFTGNVWDLNDTAQ